MTFLLLSILCSAMLVLAFKIFEHRGIPVFPAIVVNYLAATTCAFIFLPDREIITSGALLQMEWLPFSLFLGSLFIAIFNLTSITTLRYGVSTASVAMKLGLVFPVFLAFTLYDENWDSLKLLGILCAFVSVVLSSIKEQPGNSGAKASIAILPAMVFAGSGVCDSLTQYANKTYLQKSGMEEFSFSLFASAALIGSLILLFQMIKSRRGISFGSILGGVVLGIVNYFSFLFILKALASVSWGSSVVFPLSNLGTVAAATIAGIILFKERISKLNTIGLFFAVLSIVLILLSGH